MKFLPAMRYVPTQKVWASVFLFPPEPTAISNPELRHIGGNVQKRNSLRNGIHQEPSLVKYGNGDDDSPGTRNGILRNKEFLGNGVQKRGEQKRGMHNLGFVKYCEKLWDNHSHSNGAITCGSCYCIFSCQKWEWCDTKKYFSEILILSFNFNHACKLNILVPLSLFVKLSKNHIWIFLQPTCSECNSTSVHLIGSKKCVEVPPPPNLLLAALSKR